MDANVKLHPALGCDTKLNVNGHCILSHDAVLLIGSDTQESNHWYMSIVHTLHSHYNSILLGESMFICIFNKALFKSS